jgi:hypothetical protein
MVDDLFKARQYSGKLTGCGGYMGAKNGLGYPQ